MSSDSSDLASSDFTEVDAALIHLFENASATELGTLGPLAFHRVNTLYRSPMADLPPRLAELISELKRESIDCWNHARGIVARANPTLYLDLLAETAPDTLDLVVLATVTDPRAVSVLVTALGSPEWLHRYHAAKGLFARRQYRALAPVINDPVDMVRDIAERASRRA